MKQTQNYTLKKLIQKKDNPDTATLLIYVNSATCQHAAIEYIIILHVGEFAIGLYFKVKDSTKSSVRFLVLVGGIFLYHLKAYLYGFILSPDSKFLGAPSGLKIDFKSIFSLFFGCKAILGHEGGTQKIKATAQNKAIYISFQMI